MINNVVFFLGYKVIWFVGISASNAWGVWACPVLGSLYMAWYIYHYVHNRRSFVGYILAVLAIGIGMEIGVFGQWAYTLNHPIVTNPWIPLWLVAIWGAFGCVCHRLSGSLFKTRLIPVLVGAIFGPLAYRSAQALGAIAIVPGIGWYTLSIGWGVIMMVIYGILRMNRPSPS